MKLRGASFLEAIVAIFILAGGTLSCCSLLIQAFRFQERRQSISDATVVAEQTLESIRLWAETPAQFNTDWSIYSDVDLPEVGAGYVPHVEVSPLRAYERLNEGYRVVSVSVRRGERSVVEVTGEVAFPICIPSRVEVQPVTPTANLAINATLEYRARLMDTSDQEIHGVNFDWSVAGVAGPSGAGMGRIERTAPDEARLTHVIYNPTQAHQPGEVTVQARCRYRNQVLEQSSPVLVLEP